MGKIDTLTKKYMSDNKVFADVFNFYLYNGEQVINPEKLHPMDTTAIGVPFKEGTKGSPVQKYRDVIKYVTAMEDEQTAYLVLGIENQTNIHYAMPTRNQLYDALEYTRQIEQIATYHRENKDKEFTSSEYLSGFDKDDRLIPVITLVIYFGTEEWNAPRSLHEMLTVQNKEILSFVNDYKLNLIVPAELSEEDFEKFHTNLREVMQYIQYSADKKKLSTFVENNDHFAKMDRNAAMLLNECTKSGLKFKKSGRSVDMCRAIKEIRQEEFKAGREEGREEEREESAKRMIKKGKFSLLDIAESLDMSLEKVQKIKETMKDSI